jgi:protocatechuate 3,4-dioxygenase beta subunit
VQDAAGKPITNATAEARRISGNSQFQMNARADRQGRLRVAGQPQGQRYEMTVFAKGYGSAHQEVGEAETLTTNCEFAPFVLARADRKLAGQVLDAEGKPAAGVQLQLNGEGQPGGWAKTDATGHFLFDAVCAGPVSLNARVQVGPANYVGSLTQAEGGDTNVVFRLDRNNQNGARAAVASKITGTVTDPAGAPAAGVRVALYPNNFGASEAVTDAQGRYSISIQNVQSMNGQDVSPCLVARSLQRNLAAARDIDAKTTNLDLRLEPALTISAKAEDAGGHPITNATASLIFMTGYMGMQMDAKPKRADELGRLRLEALPPGRQYTVNIMAPGYGASAPVTVPAGQKTTNFVCPTFVLRRADRKLAGQVVGLDGTALAGVQLSIRGEGQPNAFARSDATGHFSFAAVCEGPVTVFANYQGGPRRGYLNATVQAQGGDTNVAVRFVANNNFGGQGVIVTTSGRVLDAAGAPAPGVAVTLLTGYGGNMEGVQSDADGKYLINWRLNRQINTPTSILARNLAQNLAAIREIDDAATNVDLRLEPGLTLAVKVEDAAGKPIRSAAVTLSYSTGMSSFSLANGSPNNSDAQGGIQFTALPQGKQYIVSINAAGYGTASRTLTPGETKTTNLVCPTFVLRAADRQLAGQVLGVDGKPVPGTQLNIQGDGQPFGNAQSDATGRFSFPSVSDGPINISASYQGGGGRFFLTTTAQARGGDTNVTVQFVANNNFGGQGVTVTTRGTVYDPSGAPVPGVALALESGFGGGAVEIQSDAAGKYSLTWKSNPQMNSAPSLLARSVERNLATVHNLDETTTNLDLHLEEGLTITTKVQDARGKPIADASAGLFGFSENRGYPMNAPPARADDQGRIRFENLPPGQKYSLNIAATGYGSASQQVEAGETKVKNYDFPAVTLRLADRKLAGQVLGPDGKPVADANVSTQGDGQPTLTARTDATGHFSFAAVGEGPVTLNANSQGGARGYLNASIQAQGGDTNAVIHFAINGQFGPSAQVVTTSGTVTDPAGAPVAGARLMVMTGYGGNNAEIQSEADGKFSVTWQRPNFNGAIPMIPFILARQTARDLAGTADLDETTNNLDLHLQPGLTLAVKVQDGAGKPIPTATASLTTWSGNRGFSFEPAPASANALGLIEIKCLPQERRYSAHITAPGYGSVNAEAQIGDTKTTRFEFPPAVLRLANQKLAGQVLGPDDKPVAGAFVNVQPINGQPGGNTTSDAQGHFAFNAVCDGPIQLNANTQGGANFMAGNVQAQGGDTNVVLRLNVNGQAMPANGRSVTTTGTVLNPDGAPVAGVRLSVLPLSAGNTEVKSDDAGKFSLTWRWQPPGARGGAAAARAGGPAIPALQFLLVARDLEHHWATAVDVDEKTTNVEVRLQAPLTITGSVVDPQGAPVKNAMISLMMWAGRSAATFQQAQAAFDTQGAFSITPLPQSQHYSLTVRATGYGNDSRQVQATETDTESLALPPFTLKPANLKLEGRVVDASDKPVPGAQVNLGGVGQPTDNTVTDAKGHFAFTHVCEGPVRVTAFDRSAGNGPMVPSSAQAQGGDTDVVVKLGVTPTGARVVAQAAPRMSPLKPAPWSWDALSQWPMDHVEAVMALAGLQVMALMVTAGCLFWFTRRQRD